MLWGGGALIGLVAAGFALFTAKGSAGVGVPAEYIAIVNQRPIYVSDYLAQLQSEFNVTLGAASVDQRRRVLVEMIREELFVQRALELDEPEIDPDVRNTLVASVQSQIAVDATVQTPSDAELTAYYRAHVERYSSIGYLTVADLTAAAAGAGDRAALAAAAAALRAGQPRAAVEKQFALREAAAGEQVYFAARLHLGARLFDAVKSLSAGQVSDPIQSDDGLWHVLVMLANNPPRPRDFALARNEVYLDYRQERVRSIGDKEFQYLEHKADIRINRAYEPR
jgi:parvulin-like peptidyl-prolyl isomerase